jgi:imidazole glycerol-phosphate synthase subunit HisH
VDAESTYYHLHSYAALDCSGPAVAGTSVYGRQFVAAVEKPPLYGVQFHPEKSSHQGLRLLGNFVNICAERAHSA